MRGTGRLTIADLSLHFKSIISDGQQQHRGEKQVFNGKTNIDGLLGPTPLNPEITSHRDHNKCFYFT
jgi:hypothetical protein